MLILLPPSEGKTAPVRGPRLDHSTRSFAGLEPIRARVLDALVRLSRGDERTAMRTLGLGKTQGGELAVNAALGQAHCAPALTVYTGVLYEALDAATLTAQQRRRVQSSTAISSALFGLIRPNDPIPAYRLSGDAALPRLGALSARWRNAVSAELAQIRGPILDLRSGAYLALGPVPPDLADRAAVGRVLLERNGRRSVVSHHNKATKGRIVRALSDRPAARSLDGLLTQLEDLGYRLELHEGRGIPVLDVIVREL